MIARVSIECITLLFQHFEAKLMIRHTNIHVLKNNVCDISIFHFFIFIFIFHESSTYRSIHYLRSFSNTFSSRKWSIARACPISFAFQSLFKNPKGATCELRSARHPSRNHCAIRRHDSLRGGAINRGAIRQEHCYKHSNTIT